VIGRLPMTLDYLSHSSLIFMQSVRSSRILCSSPLILASCYSLSSCSLAFCFRATSSF